jgi:1,4-dihydroxy-2-naphthoate octaprenyltransferase
MTLLFGLVLFWREELVRDLPGYVPVVYLAVMFSALMWYCLRYRGKLFLLIGGFNIAMVLLYVVGNLYDIINALGLRALGFIFWGLVCFAIAFVISALKGNLLQAVVAKLKTRWKES